MVVRQSIKILLLNECNELLLMCANDPNTHSPDGSPRGRFWNPIGGRLEEGETLEQAAVRELYEETGLRESDVVFGPLVWYGEFELILAGVPTYMKQHFIVAHLKNNTAISLDNLVEDEISVVESLEWFSLEKIKTHPEVIYPVELKNCLPAIIAGNYPTELLMVDLGKKPQSKSVTSY